MKVSLFLVTLSLVCGNGVLMAQQTLREIADQKKVYVGNLISIDHLAAPDTYRNGDTDAHFTSEYNAAVLENSMKMSFVLPTSEPANIHSLSVDELRATLRENQIETFLSRAEWAGMRKRGHAMIWFNQAPNWLNASARAWTGQQVFAFSRKYILALGQICGDRIDEWDVINEAISDQSPGGQRQWRQGTWYQSANDGSQTDWGEATFENYLKMLFVWAREAQPNARLHYNDYAIEHFNASPSSKNRYLGVVVPDDPGGGVGGDDGLPIVEVARRLRVRVTVEGQEDYVGDDLGVQAGTGGESHESGYEEDGGNKRLHCLCVELMGRGDVFLAGPEWKSVVESSLGNAREKRGKRHGD
ncbi:MAG: endo-1,4-beta-xylanase, partial [Bacteroidota bacterium]